ncbi:MAG: hypothetical protein E7522_01265 [Ruminococcaceae bacterium]|nr:hypothetical protein [Oscillospiraceae bacterium]
MFFGEVWHDYSLEKITIDYDNIVLDLELDNILKSIVLENFIAIEYIGQWDENIIKSISLVDDCEFIEKTLNKIKNNNDSYLKGAGKKDVNAQWKCVVIELIDGVRIRIVCDNIVLR